MGEGQEAYDKAVAEGNLKSYGEAMKRIKEKEAVEMAKSTQGRQDTTLPEQIVDAREYIVRQDAWQADKENEEFDKAREAEKSTDGDKS